MKHLWWAPLSLILACHLNGHLLSGPIERPPTSVSVESYTAQAPTPVANELTFGVDSANGNSYTTASISPCANCLVVAWVVSKDATIPPPSAETPTLSGASMTWSNVLSNTFGANAETRLTMFRAQSASPGTGALTIDFAGDEQDIVKWNVVEFDSVRTGGNGINAMLQATAADHGSQTLDTLTVELGRFEHAGNAAVGGFAIDGTTGKNAGDGFTILNPAEPFPFFLGTLIEWKTSNDSTVDISLDGGDELAGTAFELGVQPRCNAKVEWSVIGSPTTVRVYRDSASLGLFAVLDSTTQNEYTDSLAPEGSRYYPEAFFATTGNSFAGDTVTAPPCRPSNIALDPITVDSIVVAWADSSGIEDSTHIERCTGAGCSDFSQIASVGPNVTEYRDGGLSGGTTYRYQLRTSKDSLFSIYSPTGSATTPSADVIAFDNSETAFDTTATDVLKWEHVVTTAASDTPAYLLVGVHNEAQGSSTLRDKTIVFSSLAVTENGSDLTEYSTASVSPGADALLLAACGNRDDDGTIEQPDSAGGNGLTWVQEATQLRNVRRVTLFRAMGASPSSGAVTCYYPDQQIHGWISVVQVDSVLTTGTGGADAVVQSATGSCATCTSLTVTLAGFADATNNAAYGVMLQGSGTGDDVQPGTGFTEIHEAGAGAGRIQAERQLGEDTSVDWTWTNSTEGMGIALELAADTVTDTTAPDMTLASVTYGDQSMTAIAGASDDVTDGSNFGNGLRWYYCDQGCIDAMADPADDTVRVDPNDADADIVGASLSYARVARGAPEASAADTAIGTGLIESIITTSSDSAWIIHATTISDSLDQSATGASTDRYEVRLGASPSTRMAALGADRGPITPAQTDTAGVGIIDDVGRAVHGALALKPATAAVGGGTGTMTIATSGFVNDSLAAAGSPLPAFWGADGSGAAALWDGSPSRCDTLPVEILTVTNTNNTGAGSLRQALTDASNDSMTYIVFRTGGRVDGFNHDFSKTCVYEMGQSAPGDGFAVNSPGIAREFGGGTSSHVVRYEAWYGDPEDVNDSDAVGVGSGADYLILDHVSILGGADEIFRIDVTTARPEFITLSNLVMGVTSKTTAGWSVDDTDLSGGNQVNLGPISMLRSLFADFDHRAPRVGCDDTIPDSDTWSRTEILNNMARNWNLSGRASDRIGCLTLDEVGGIYRRAFGNNGLPPTRYSAHYIPPDTSTPQFVAGSIHYSDLHCEDETTGGSCGTDYDLIEQIHDGSPLPDSMRRASRHTVFVDSLPWPATPLPASTIVDAILDSAKSGVLNADVGSYRGINSDGSAWVGGTSRRPHVDSLFVWQWVNGGGIQEAGADVSWTDDYGGVPTHAAGTPCTDADGDGMCDAYETACSVTDPTADDDGDGIPNIQDQYDGHDLEGINVKFGPGEAIDSIVVELDTGGGFAAETTLVWPDTILTVRSFQRDNIRRGLKYIGTSLDATTAPDTAGCY